MTRKKEILRGLQIFKVSEKGHSVALHPKDKREIYILGAVPGDVLDIEIYKRVKDIYYADVKEIVSPSKCRVRPKEGEVYKSTSPWQIFDFDCENKFKKELVRDFFKEHAGVELESNIFFPKNFNIYGYRNKIEYGFWRDKKSGKYSFSFFKRGSSRGKIPVEDSALNHPAINEVGKKFLKLINSKNIDFAVLKYLILRYSYKTNTVLAQLIIQDDFEKLKTSKEEFQKFLDENEILQGLIVSYSTPKTPGARTEKDFLKLGKTSILESIAKCDFYYEHEHFFQVYVPLFDFVFKDIIFELEKLQKKRGEKWKVLLDYFAGVGVFGIALKSFADTVKAVEISAGTKALAEKNAKLAGVANYKFVESDVDEVENELSGADLLVLDPPRAGLSKNTIKAVLKEMPETIVYLSCNPKTQAMDYNWLKRDYKIVYHKGYNLFPRTPHIEHLLVLERKRR